MNSSKDPLQKIKDKIIYYLHRRDHSEKELRQKLKKFDFPIEEIEASIQWAKERKYLSDPIRLSERHVQRLQKKKKGQKYIQNYLNQKGLPPSPIDTNEEFENALEIAEKMALKLRSTLEMPNSANKTESDYEKMRVYKSLREKIGRKLLSRGFSMEIARKVMMKIQF